MTTPAGISLPGTLYLGAHPATTAVSLGNSGAFVVSGTGSSFSGPIGTGTNPMSCGALSSGAVTASGDITCGTHSMTCGALSSGSISCGTSSVTCGSLQVPGGALSAPSVCFDAQSGFYESGGAVSISIQGQPMGTWNNGGLSMTSGQLDVGPVVLHNGGLTISGNGPVYAGTNPLTCGAVTASGTVSCGTNSMTCGALSCSGAVTASGTVSCGTNSMTCGALSCSSLASTGDITWPHYNIAVSLAGTAGVQSIATSTITVVSWTTKVSGTGIAFTNPTTTFTIPIAGWYSVDYGVSFGSNATGVRTMWVVINSSIQQATMSVAPTNGDFTRFCSSFQRQFAANDTIQIRVYQTSGGSLNIGGDSSNLVRLEIDRMHD